MDIHSALKNDEFYPTYQPIINVKTGTVHSYEVLARCKSKTKGEMMPCHFFPSAEKHSMSHLVTLAVVRKALAEHSKAPLALNLNISPSEIIEPTLFHDLEELIAQYNYPKEKLTIELTEGRSVGGWNQLRERVYHAVDTGWRCSLDDYGVESQTLQRLTELPVSQFKLDRSILPTLVSAKDHVSAKKREFIRAINSLAHNLEIEFVIEGVESSQQVSFLNDIGVELHQGYFYAKPSLFENIQLTNGMAVHV